MAEIILSIIGLGSLYIISNQEKKSIKAANECFENKNDNTKIKNNKKVSFQNNVSTKSNKEGFNNINSFNSLTGNNVNFNDFKHNNMQPFFGAKIRGASSSINNTESLLDNKLGSGSQNFNKKEMAPLFKPDENYSYNNGMPSTSDFIQTRMNTSNKMSNYTVCNGERVGPNNTCDSKNGLDGFNNGMNNRNLWQPKNVDDLRTINNPKNIYDLNGHEGPAVSKIKNVSTVKQLGNIEKYMPDTYYESGPNRWFTTTGSEVKPSIRSEQMLTNENRGETSREYYGIGSYNQPQTINSNIEFEESKKQNLGALPLTNLNLSNKNKSGKNDHNINSYNILPNNRTTDKDSDNIGGIFGVIKAGVAPIVDILQPTRKENVVGNLRINGNVASGVYGGHIFNEKDKTKVTNREMTTDKINMNHLNVQNQSNNNTGKHAAEYQAIQNQRATTNHQHIGTGGSNNFGIRPYNAEYNQQNNVNKTYEIHNNHGNMSVFNSNQNVEINKNENILYQSRQTIPNGGPSMIPSSEFLGELNGIQTYENNSNRLDSSLLDAFKQNPYTKSLSSVA
jgi:hypothetical protein